MKVGSVAPGARRQCAPRASYRALLGGPSTSPLGPGHVHLQRLGPPQIRLAPKRINSASAGAVRKGTRARSALERSLVAHENHSAVLAVCMAVLVGTGLVYLLLRRKIMSWWAYCLCGAAAGVLPGLFYVIAIPREDWARVPGAWSALFAAMMIVGFVWGTLMGLVTFGVVGRRKQLAAS